MQQYNCQNGQSWYDVCLNTYGSLDYLGKLVSDNGGELNVQPTTNTVIYWDRSLVKDSSLLSLIKNNGYVYNTGVSIPLPYIQKFTAGVSPITFISDGSNGWDVGIIAQPTTLQIPSGETIDSVAYEIKHYVGGTNTGTISGTLTSDDTINTGALGAGTFEISLLYHISDGSEVNTLYAFQVDATDVIIDYCKINGATVNSVSGLDISVSADVNSSVSTTVTWFSFDGGSNFIQVGTGVNATITMPLGAIYVVPVITLGSGFPDYPSTELASYFSVTIS